MADVLLVLFTELFWLCEVVESKT